MEDLILISNLNDFIFCSASIYFHGLYGGADKLTYQSAYQINGTKAHENVDAGKYSTRKNIITALEVYSQEYGVVGKIDIYDKDKKMLIERKKHVSVVYDGYVFQLYAQCFSLNDNVVVKDKNGKTKHQSTCYQLFMICVIGNISITSGLIQRSKKFGFSIFDTYYGVFHKCFYMRKSLVCDLMEPMRPIIEYAVRKAIRLGQCKADDFGQDKNRWYLEWKNNPAYIRFLMEAILEYKDAIFLYVQQYYRFFMKMKSVEKMPLFLYE
jgi:hypothetical protein